MTNVRKKRNRARWVIAITIWTFFLAIVFGFLAHLSLNEIQSITISFFILILVIMIGIVFDIVGTAAAAANIAPLNAKAARKVDGAKRGVYMVKHADRVANFCNDVAGDISGIISGTLATVIVYKLVVDLSFSQADFYFGILLTALVAAFTVGGKALGKGFAISHSTEVIMLVGLLIDRLLKPLNWFGKRG